LNVDRDLLFDLQFILNGVSYNYNYFKITNIFFKNIDEHVLTIILKCDLVNVYD